jgi:hypothetical protein
MMIRYVTFFFILLTQCNVGTNQRDKCRIATQKTYEGAGSIKTCIGNLIVTTGVSEEFRNQVLIRCLWEQLEYDKCSKKSDILP